LPEGDMMRLASMVATLGLFFTANVLSAQTTDTPEKPSPFGLHMGMTKDQIGEIVKEVSTFKFQLQSVSEPHQDLETYVATVTPNAGLCFIRALAPTMRISSDGTELKSAFEDLKLQIEAIYGKPYVVDSLKEGSTLDRPRDWMRALFEQERTLMARWSAPDDNLPMKPTIRKVYVAAFAESRSSGYLVVEFYFDNYDQCQEEINDAVKRTFQ
jgi:hypothetical protein